MRLTALCSLCWVATAGIAQVPLASLERVGDASFIEGVGVRLTPDAQSKAGIASVRSTMPHLSEWQVDATFQLHGAGVTLVGDGVAVWYTREKLAAHPGGLLGANPRFAGIAVLLATYIGQSRRPRVSVVANDGTEVVSRTDSGTYQSSLHPAAGCNLDRYLSGDAFVSVRLRISDAGRHAEVLYDIGTAAGESASRQWTSCVSVPEIGMRLAPEGVLSVSASTGDLTQAHDLVELAVTVPEETPRRGVSAPSPVRERQRPWPRIVLRCHVVFPLQSSPAIQIVRSASDKSGRTVSEVVTPNADEMDGVDLTSLGMPCFKRVTVCSAPFRNKCCCARHEHCEKPSPRGCRRDAAPRDGRGEVR